MTIPILFENDSVLAADKPPGLSSNREAGSGGLPGVLAAERGGILLPVHRLDKEAGGVILFAKTPDAHRFLNGAFERREVRKTYLALVHGRLKRNRGTVDMPIREFGSGRMGVDAARGKPSVTEFEVEERFDAYTLVRVRPVTGRRHQIRVHLYALGHPIAGDSRYGDPSLRSLAPRLMLHALEIAFPLPEGGTATVASPPPPSFAGFLEAVRGAGRI
jgi:tRNA pseudouridine32 synthase/23S rRNA pseudouridine746 synthase